MQVIRYKTDSGTVIGLHIKDGRKFTKVILMDAAGIRVKRLPLSEKRYISEIKYRIPKAKKKFRAAGRKFGITKAAKLALRG